jgi:hypothetical protein
MEWSIDKKPDVTSSGEAEVRSLSTEDLLMEVINSLKKIELHLASLTREEFEDIL